MTFLKKIDWYKIGIMALFSVCGLLYSQQNSIIAAQGVIIKENCTKTEKALEKKVDNAVLLEMIKSINVQQGINTERLKEQRITNEKVLENIQKLNINVILLNERMKKESLE